MEKWFMISAFHENTPKQNILAEKLSGFGYLGGRRLREN